MSLNKKAMVREIGRRTRLKNREVEAVIEALVELWMEELISGGRIELENFIVLSTHRLQDRVQLKISAALRKLIRQRLMRSDDL